MVFLHSVCKWVASKLGCRSSRLHNNWQQSHDPFSQTTDGSDYVYISGDTPNSCGGFVGLHNRHEQLEDPYAKTTEMDSTDTTSCWNLQILPLQQYQSSSIYSGYIDSFSGMISTHQWQNLWVR